MPGLTLTLFGPPQLARDGETMHLRSRRCLALLAYLAITDRAHRRGSLASLLWPESDPARAQSSLTYTLSLLRRTLAGGWLVVDRETIGLDGSEKQAVDVVRFRDLLAQCERRGHDVGEAYPECLPLLEEAAALAQGDFMAGFALPDSAQFIEWQAQEARALRRELVGALQRLAEGYAARGEPERAIAHATRWVALNALNEAAHRILMRLYAGSGRDSAALQQYEACERALMSELGVSPSAETRELREAIEEGRVPQLQARPPTISSAPARPRHNLPAQPTAFVGREEELEQIAQRLADPACRLLTVVGPGGMGKSRLAIQAGEQLLSAFRDGVWFVPLAPVESVDLLPSDIMEALGVLRGGGQDPQTQLVNYLRERHLLLILDNFEHLLEAGTLVAEMLAEVSELKLLVTSRERLGLQGEWLFPLGGMGLPGEEVVLQVEGGDVNEQALTVLQGHSAVNLFVQRARQVQPELSLLSAGPASVARICRLVEGMPLAIELAAAWVRVMDCEEIAREIETNLGFLATTLRDVPQRHRSMRAVFDQSWDLLSAEERSALRKLSVFRGGFRREAAETVAMRPERSPASLLTLTTLLDRSWVRRSSTGRYEMHELVRQYCAGRLDDAQTVVGERESERVRDRHSEYYAAFLSDQEPRLKGRDQVEALEGILEEMGNVRAAWDWAVERGNVDALGRSVDSLHRVGLRRGWQHEVMQPLNGAAAMLRERLLADESVESAPPTGEAALLLGRILCRQGNLAIYIEGFGQVVALCEESVALLEGLAPSVQQQKACVLAKIHLGWFLQIRGDSSRAGELLHEAVAQAIDIGDEWNQGYALWILSGPPIASGHYAEAEGYLREALVLYDRLGDQWMKAWCLSGLTRILRMTGAYAEAESLAWEDLRIRRELGYPQGLDVGLLRLAEVEVALGKHKQARRHYRDMLAIAEEYGSVFARPFYAYGMATIAAAEGAYAEAAELLEDAATSFHRLGRLGDALRASIKLGHAVLALGEAQRAAQCFNRVLREAMESAQTPEALGALVGIATLSTREGETTRATELLAVALHHPAAYHEDRVRAEELLTELKTSLSPDAFAAATARGQTCELEKLVAEMLGGP